VVQKVLNSQKKESANRKTFTVYSLRKLSIVCQMNVCWFAWSTFLAKTAFALYLFAKQL